MSYKNFYNPISILVFMAQFQIVVAQNINPCTNTDSNLCYSNKPFPVVDFDIEKKFESAENTAIYQSPLLADIDGDCIPEIIIAGLTGFQNNPRFTSGIRVVNSKNGQTISNIPTAYYNWNSGSSFAVADVDFDGIPEIIIPAAGHTINPTNVRGRLVCYNFDGTVKWISDAQFGANANFQYGGTIGLADFNQDGIPEVYIYNEIFNAQTGVKLCDGGSNGLGKQLESRTFGTVSVSIAGQLDDNPNDLELAAGYSIYKVQINNTSGQLGNSMVANNITVNGSLRDGYTSIGDINQDGLLDVIVSSNSTTSQIGLYVYTMNSGNTSFIAGTSLPSGGGGLPNDIGPSFVGDIDGSGVPSIGLTRPYRLLTYKYDGTTTLELFWVINTNDESGQTGLTMFDFNQDGVQEIVYRDETDLRIINGSVNPPVDLATVRCFSQTGVESPIVGDIDNSGESKICVTCGTARLGTGGINGKLVVFGAPAGQQPWAPSRGIWNQYAYHVFNVEDDLTIPAIQKNNATYANEKYNNFYVQASLIDEDGNYLQQVPVLGGNISCLNFDWNTERYTIEFAIFNSITASLEAPSGIVISLFNGNPEVNGTLIGTTITNSRISPGDTINNLSFTFSENNLSELFIVINTNGSSIGQPYSENDFLITECDYNNNILSLSNLPIIEEIIDTICDGKSFNYRGVEYSQSGTFFYNTKDINGCDSIHSKLNLMLLEDTLRESVTVCDSFFWVLNEQTFYQSGTYTDNVTLGECSSFAILDLTILESIQTEDTIFVCTPQDERVEELVLQRSNGCDSIHTNNFVAYGIEDLPVASFTTDPSSFVILPEGYIQTINNSVNADSYLWDFGDGSNWLSEINPSHIYTNRGRYTITLMVNNQTNCPDQSRVNILVTENFFVYIPNAFTPDESGPMENEGFRAVITGEEAIEFIIFNRWGEILFKTTDKNQKWDGTFKGEPCQQDVYAYLLKVLPYEGELKTYRGTVTLLR